MASLSAAPMLLFLLLLALTSNSSAAAASFHFQVGGTRGWAVPPPNDTRIYNDWASDNRFRVGDTIHFRYRKDSVMEVSEEEYKKCNSTRPILFSNTGDTVVKLDRQGPFYFISGAAGHCQKGQKMIVKVMSSPDSGSSSSSGGSGSTSTSESGYSALPQLLAYGVVAQLAFSRLF
ncbi:mavicyanin-like [Diospyros lotus]|uniref:mavicyanin-like n=1 Tax=Diospyros lotus TaxID=55363 RepID=UPI00225410E0|nr:mavicyanin-like [Diospyros lotus]